MTDPYTREHLKCLASGSLPQCEINKKIKELHDKIIPPNPSNFIPELSPNWNPNTGRLESDNRRPVRMFDLGSSNTGHIAKKWIIKD
jgi:hypothetical protein